jgi:peptidoglycan hydrolase-like protein with peptidoglycan-binding domain
MAKSRLAGFAVALALAIGSASAESPPIPPPKPATASDAQRVAFLAMPEVDRKAIQDALGWLGFYNGVLDGEFGKRTLDAITAYQSSVKAPTDGLVTAAQLTALKLAARKARAAVGFQIFDDPVTGMRIGAPLKWLEKKNSTAADTRLASRDGAVFLELTAAGQGPLADLYKRMAADGPGRKITYKAIKADAFFVIAGEEGGRKFYRRYAEASGNASDPQPLRGFVFAYPLAEAAALDPVTIAIANSFEPFPTAPAAKPPEAAPLPIPTPTAPALVATALIVARGEALTALRQSDCRDPTILGKPAEFARIDTSGLAVLAGDFGAGAAMPRQGADGADLIVLSLAPGATPGKVVLEAAEAPSAAISPTRRAVVASLTAGGRGAPVFDRSGGLAAIVGPMAAPPKRFGAVTLAEPHELIAGAQLASFLDLGEAAPAAELLGASDIARKMRGAIVGIFCAP